MTEQEEKRKRPESGMSAGVTAALIALILAVTAGVLALPVMLFWKDRARFYSWLHRVWAKTSEQPVWMAQAEKASADFY